jgi:hypothetical protein
MKLTTAQQEVIDRLKKGEVIHYISGMNSRCFFHNDMKRISWPTLIKLEKLNLVKRTHTKVVMLQ